MQTKILKGKVVKGPTFSKGSKSEHEPLYLDIGDKKIRIRMRGGNSFSGDNLQKYLGKIISAEGIENEYFFDIIPLSILIEPLP